MRKMPGLKRGTKHKMADYAKEHYDFPLTKKSEHKPLKGVRVIDAGNMVAAPFATVLLADFGADVIKIEHPKYGDGKRKLEPIMDGIPLWWKSVSRNKRCITLDLGKPEGGEIFRQIVKGQDVVVENYRPGTFEKWGIGPDVLRHRIIVTYEAEAQGVTTDAIIKKVFNAVPVP